MALGLLDTLIALGGRVRDRFSRIFWEASRELPDAVAVARRWERRDASHEEMAYDLAENTRLGPYLRTGRSLSRLSDAAPFGTPEMDWESLSDEQDSPQGYSTSGAEVEHHLLNMLSRNPDFLGSIIQRERRRGNPLFL